MSRKLFFNLIGFFSRLTSSILLSFAYFAIFSILKVDKNPVTVIGLVAISYFVVELFYYFSKKIYEGNIMQEFEHLIEVAVLDHREKKQIIKSNIKLKAAEMFELNIFLITFSSIVVFLSIIIVNFFEFGMSLKLISRELISVVVLSISMLIVLRLLLKILTKVEGKKGFQIAKEITVNGFYLYIVLLIYFFSLLDSVVILMT